MLKGIDFAVSTYGFTQQFIENPDFSIADIFENVAKLGVKKVELVGAQTFQNYPVPTDDEIQEVLDASKEYGVEVYSYGGYIDMGKITGHDMTDAEMINEVVFDLMTAKKLGASILRSPYLPVRLLPQIEMFAKMYGVKVGYEMHAPDQPSSPEMKAYAAMFKQLNSEYIGFIPDFGCFIERPNRLAIERFVGLGAKRELLDYLIENRWSGMDEQEMTEKLLSMGGGEAETMAVSEWFGYMSFQKADLEGFKALLPYCIYFHGKFYHIDEDCIETTIPYDKLLKMIVESGFTGTILTEYEGHTFYLNDAVEQIERHLKMEKNILENL